MLIRVHFLSLSLPIYGKTVATSRDVCDDENYLLLFHLISENTIFFLSKKYIFHHDLSTVT